MAIIQFGPWIPDQPRLGNTCITARNVYPITNGYGPFPGPTAVTDALVAPCLGVISFKQVNGTLETFAGTSTKLFRLSGTSWTDVSKALGTYSASTQWRFAVFGSRLIATNGIDAVQRFDLGTDIEFADIAGAPTHNFPIVIRDVLVAIDTTDGSGLEVKFSAVNDSEKWTADCGGGGQDFPDGGPLVGGTGGEFGVILQESGLTRMNFVGGDLRFTFDKIEGSVGGIAADSIVEYKGQTFYLSEEGFQIFNGVESQNTSDEQVSDTFFSELTYASRSTIRGALDARNSSVIWSVPVSGARKLFIYNYRLGQWADSDADVDCLHRGITSTGDILSGFDSLDKLARFNGSDLTPILSTGDIQLAKDRRAFVKSVRGLVDAAHDITVGKKTALSDTETTVTGSSNAQGKVSIRANDRYHRFQLDPTASFSEAIGVDVEAQGAGIR